jgi:uncharacterized protein YkwD
MKLWLKRAAKGLLILGLLWGASFAGYSLKKPVVPAVLPVKTVQITEYELWKDTNKLRTEPLELDQALTQTAVAKCADMAAKDYWAHGDWESFVRPLNRQFYGENLAYGQWTSQQVVNEWKTSPGHYKNIINTEYHRVGYAVCAFRGSELVVQHFSD